MSTGVASPFATSLSPSSITGPIQVAHQQGLANQDEQSAKRARAHPARSILPARQGSVSIAMKTIARHTLHGERCAALDATAATVPYCAGFATRRHPPSRDLRRGRQVTPAMTRSMPPRLAFCCTVIAALWLGSWQAFGAGPASPWQAVLVAGDDAQPVFD